MTGLLLTPSMSRTRSGEEPSRMSLSSVETPANFMSPYSSRTVICSLSFDPTSKYPSPLSRPQPSDSTGRDSAVPNTVSLPYLLNFSPARAGESEARLGRLAEREIALRVDADRHVE